MNYVGAKYTREEALNNKNLSDRQREYILQSEDDHFFIDERNNLDCEGIPSHWFNFTGETYTPCFNALKICVAL